ncbi:acyloxyacyl hydrolase [Reinekea sp.]|uniref:acyloxyacyl hydrolase n=1 Tax=Reinekea sp. TaxID=1970455 RepID=UPI002A80520C|nr:acyloxyacyl hydrolase [Reinekea sp.]
MKKILGLVLILFVTSIASANPAARPAAIGVSVLSLLAWNPMRLTGVGLDYGVDGDFSRTRLLWLWDLPNPLRQLGPLTLSGHLELAMGQTAPSPPDLTLGLTPLLEWRASKHWWVPFIETGLGVNYISLTQNRDRTLSTHFQFGEILGLAMEYRNLKVGLRYQHLSNADMVVPNNGYNFYGAVISYRY